MRSYKFSGLSDHDLLRELATLVSRERAATAAVVTCLAEVEERRLYLPAGYPSLHAYCVGELRLSEGSSYKRIQAARAGRQHPVLFEMLTDGRLNVSDVVVLAPYLTDENAAGLISEAAGKSRTEIERMLAARFPKCETMPMVCALPAAPSLGAQLSPGTVIPRTTEQSECGAKHAAAAGVAAAAPIAQGRYSLHASIGERTHERLVQLQELLSHRFPQGGLEEILDYAFAAAVRQAEKERFAATDKPRRAVLRSSGRRTIPAGVRRAVWRRDGGQCTFVSDQGHRCGSRRFLEYDHVEPVARGGKATVEGIRLRCRAHNQFEAERHFGAGFMDERREQARRAAEARADTRVRMDHEHGRDLTAGLRNLGFRAEEARRAAEFCLGIDATMLEERMIAALKFLRPSPAPVL